MVDFDRLNRETKEYKSRDVDRFSGNNTYNNCDFNRRNNETFKMNNGQYPQRPY